MNTQKQIVLIVVLLFVFMGGCTAYTLIDLPVRAPDQVTWTQNQSIERGALLFANNCRTCHGISGKGSDEGAIGLPLNKPQFKDQDPLILKANQALIKTTLYCGRAGTRMPAWLNTNGGSLNAIQIQHLIDLITAPVDAKDAAGDDTSHGWNEAVEFGHNLNRETSALVGGDTLDTIAKQHRIGPAELAKANNLPVEGVVKQGTVLHVPGFKTNPNGYDYHVYRDNETMTKIAESQHVGALMLADLNNIAYGFSEKKGTATLTLKADKGVTITGLFPGSKLAFSDGAAYTVAAGDTIDSIATQHGLTTSELVSANQAILGSLKTTDPIKAERTLKLPKATAIVQTGQTVGVIAAEHATGAGAPLSASDLATLSGVDAAAVLQAGQALKLPEGALYTIQAGDTLDAVAAAHATNAADLATANNIKATDPISPDVVLAFPKKVTAYVVKGQSLEDVSKGYGNVTADRLAQVNGLAAPTLVLAIGTSLALPPETFGATPPDSINNGTACVQHAVPASVFQTLPGISTATVVPITKPATQSKTVKFEAHADDWTVTADGTAQAANKGVVLVAKGIAISFTSVAGLHNVTNNGKASVPDLKQGDTQTITFSAAGQFTITCIYHPAMLANIFVE